MGRPEALHDAVLKMREADRWREARERAIRRHRLFRVLYAARSHRFTSRLRHGMSPGTVDSWQRLINEASDMMIVAQETVQACAEQIREAEMMARIYYEEFEGRELAREAG